MARGGNKVDRWLDAKVLADMEAERRVNDLEVGLEHEVEDDLRRAWQKIGSGD